MKALFQKGASLLSEQQRENFLDLGLLLMRLSAGGMMAIGHGWGKLAGFADKSAHFPDPLGIGSQLSLAMATGGEFFCAIAVMLGLATRLTAIPVAITMVVAAFIFHADDPWQKKELAVLYIVPFLTLAFTGPGKYSIDEMMCKKSE